MSDYRETTSGGTTKLIYWILGFMGTVLLALIMGYASRQSVDSQAMWNRISLLEARSSATEVNLTEILRRLDRIETKQDSMGRDVKALQ